MQNRLSPHPSALDDRYHIKQIKVQDGQKQHITRKGIPMRLSADFSAEILQARREWHDIFKGREKPATKNTLGFPGVHYAKCKAS